MLRLAAEFADAWNTCWLGRANELPEKLAPMHEACAAVGRDRSTLELTVGQLVTFPGLTQEEDFPDGVERFEFATPDDLVTEWRAFAEQGVKHLILYPTPYDSQCLDAITAAFRMYRDGHEE